MQLQLSSKNESNHNVALLLLHKPIYLLHIQVAMAVTVDSKCFSMQI